MPRSRRPNLTQVKSIAYQPLEKNNVSLRDDELLDENYKPVKIGGKNAPVSLSEDGLRVTGDFFLDGKLTSHRLECDNDYLELKPNIYTRFESATGGGGVLDLYTTETTTYFNNNGNHFHFITANAGNFSIGALGTEDTIFRFDTINTKLTMSSPLDVGDLFAIQVYQHGATTIRTVDDDGSAADLTITADGATKIQIFDGSEADSFHINIDGATNQMASFYGEVDNYSIFRLYEMGGASTTDYAEINVSEHGATTISTVDGAATAADLTLDVDGNIELNADGGTIAFKDASASIGSLSTTKFLCRVPIYIREQADASSDSVGTGQLWVHDTTPNELCFTDDAGTDIIGVGKYHYETKYIGYVATATGVYIPMTGYVFEQTSTSGKNEFLSFLAPYNATIQKIAFRSEIAQSGDISCRIFESSDGTEVPGTQIFRNETAVDIADDTYQELDMTSPGVGSDYSPLTKGKIYMIFINTPSASYDTNVTIVFKWDITS